MKYLIIISLLFSFLGCKLSNDLYKEWNPNLETVDELQINGEYWNINKSSWGNLWHELYYAQSFKSRLFENMDSTSIKLTLINDSLITSELIKNDLIEFVIDKLKIKPNHL